VIGANQIAKIIKDVSVPAIIFSAFSEPRERRNAVRTQPARRPRRLMYPLRSHGNFHDLDVSLSTLLRFAAPLLRQV